MNNQPAIPTGAMIKVMGLVSLVCGLLIVISERGTSAAIKRNQEIILKESVAELLPGVEKQAIYWVTADNQLTFEPNGSANPRRFFAGFDKSGNLIGIVLEASERGYADVIRTMYAYSADKHSIVGFKVLELKETPGLGDKITNDKGFLANFRALDARLDAAKEKLANAIKTVKHGTKKNAWEVDAISGATISSRAVGRMLNKSASDLLPIVERNIDRIRKGE